MKRAERRIAYFVSPHGYGHAARASAVMSALHEILPGAFFHVFTTVSPRFFADSVPAPFACHELETDIGFVQRNPLEQDLEETFRRLDAFLPFRPQRVARIARTVEELGCEMLLCDIAPLGIAVAREAGISSVLVENFTWDWIYEAYEEQHPRVHDHVAYLREVFESADHLVQAEPVCRYRRADLVVNPISRPFRESPDRVRSRLGIPPGDPVLTITMGGVPERYGFLGDLEKAGREVTFVILGADDPPRPRGGNLVILPRHSGIFPPDLFRASNVVIGKAGYSTLAEVFHAGSPFGYVSRSGFRETDILTGFIRERMAALEMGEEEFRSGRWLSRLDELLALPQVDRGEENGAVQAAAFVAELLDG